MVNPDVQATFQKLSEGKKEFRYIIFKIEVRPYPIARYLRLSAVFCRIVVRGKEKCGAILPVEMSR